MNGRVDQPCELFTYSLGPRLCESSMNDLRLGEREVCSLASARPMMPS